jgi:hypothetical protein
LGDDDERRQLVEIVADEALEGVQVIFGLVAVAAIDA